MTTQVPIPVPDDLAAEVAALPQEKVRAALVDLVSQARTRRRREGAAEVVADHYRQHGLELDLTRGRAMVERLREPVDPESAAAAAQLRAEMGLTA